MATTLTLNEELLLWDSDGYSCCFPELQARRNSLLSEGVISGEHLLSKLLIKPRFAP